MAASKSKSKTAPKSGRRKASAGEKEILKAAKRLGLIKVDLRKSLSRYAIDKAKKFAAILTPDVAVVTIPRKLVGKIAGATFARDKAIIAKSEPAERLIFDKLKGAIVGTTPGKGKGKGKKAKPPKVRVIGPGTRKLTYRFNNDGKGRVRVRVWLGEDAWQNAAKYMLDYDDPRWELNIVEEWV